MASSVFYKFASRKDESRITFDGTGISVFDLKREIIIQNNMGKANDFDLVILDGSTKQEHADDSAIIPRSSSVVVKRVPAARPGKGKAQMYIGAAGSTSSTPGAPITTSTWHKGPLSVRFDGKDEKKPVTVATPSTSQEGEAAAMAAMFKAQAENWEETQDKMSHATRIYTTPRGGAPGRGGKPGAPYPQPQVPDRPLPPSYVCYRCGQKGHWIKDCPTNNDREYDNRPRIKRTTGIPRSMLKTVDNISQSGGIGEGIMVTPEGGYVVAQPDLASWKKQATKPKGLTVAEVRERVPSDPSLVCPMDGKLLRDPIRTPCCNTAYSEENIQTHLLEHDFVCPNCSKKIQSLDKLVVDKALRTKVTDYIEQAIEESRQEGDTSEAPSKDGKNTSEEDQAFFEDQTGEMDMQLIISQIPSLQAQITQISQMLQNHTLPKQVRETTEMQYQDLQMQLHNAQMVAAGMALASQQQAQLMQMQQQILQQQQQNWSNQVASQQPPPDSAYQRLPVNNRRRNLHRERPTEYLEVSGSGSNTPRYWE